MALSAREGPKKFLLVAGNFVKTGGMDRANYALASYLANHGADVHIVAFGVSRDLLSTRGVVHHRVPLPLGRYMLGYPVMHYEAGRIARALLAEGARTVVNGGNCRSGDVNWVHHVFSSTHSLSTGSFLRRLKTDVHYHLAVRDECRIIPEARLVVTTCEQNKRDLVEHLGVSEDRIRVAYYGVDPALFRPSDAREQSSLRAGIGLPEGRPLALFVGALGDRRKGFDTLFEAWKILCSKPDWGPDLVVVGEGRELPFWQGRAREEGLSSRVHFLGFRRDVPDIFRACDAHVLPSRYEGYSLVTQEALCCGLPAFITRASGIAERYPADLRALVLDDPDDVGSLVDRLRDWQLRSNYYATAAEAFGHRLRSYTWDDMAARVAAFIDGHEAQPSRAVA